MERHFPPVLEQAVASQLATWEAQDGTRRLWAGDATLWTGGDEARWLGWLDLPETGAGRLAGFATMRDEIRREGITLLALLGMGGSSLCPFVLERSFGPQPGFPTLRVLDSTDPAQIAAFEASLDLGRTLFVVASKSGSTLEPDILRDYFMDRVRGAVGVARAGRHFAALTDPGSALEEQAAREGYRAVVHGTPSVGGRFSALSAFGLLPAALAGLDVARLLERARRMARSCGPDAGAPENPGIALGVLMGAAAQQGRDKLTLVASPGIADLGAWLEQLIAESTGKAGTAVIPVDGELLTEPARYGEDRLFAYLRLEEAPDPAQDERITALERAGQPVVRLTLRDRYDVGAEFFRWEMATAVAGAILGINPFDQPDVEAAKIETRRLMQAVEHTGELPPGAPHRPGPGLTLALREHLATLRHGDYAALLAYLPMDQTTTTALRCLRHRVRDAKRVATTLGFGPRYLHSTGQAHKGGPNSGVFLLVTADPERDLPVPGRGYSFGQVEAAQARGDLAVLQARGRRVFHVHLGRDLPADLAALDAAVAAAVA